MRCPSCGTEVDDPSAIFCPVCHRSLIAAAPISDAAGAVESAPAEAQAPLADSGALESSLPVGSPVEAAAGEAVVEGGAPIGSEVGTQAMPTTPASVYAQPAYPMQPYSAPVAPMSYPNYQSPSMAPWMSYQAPGVASQGAPKRYVGLLVFSICVLILGIALSSAGLITLLAARDRAPSVSQAVVGATVSPSAVATATPVENVILHDDFSSSASGWGNDTHCFYKADGYHIRDGYLCYAPTDQLRNVALTADIEQIAGEPTWFYGVVLRRASLNNYYVFVIDSDGEWKFVKFVNGTRTDILPYVHNSAIHEGLNVVNTLKVFATGQDFTFFVNGVQVGHATDGTFAAGFVGLNGNPEGGVEILAKDFTAALIS